MGFFQPTEPPFEIEEWQQLSHLERIKPLAQDWAENGFGTPVFVYFLYIVKLILYAGGGLLLISATTPGLGGLGDLSQLVDRNRSSSRRRSSGRCSGRSSASAPARCR